MAPILTKPLDDLRRVIGVPVVFGGEVTLDRSSIVISESFGHESDALDGLVVRAGQGLGGRAVSTGKIAAATDYLSEARITHEYDHVVASEKLRTIVAAPVVVEGAVRVVLYAAFRAPVEMGSAVLTRVSHIADHVAFELRVSDEVTRRIRALENVSCPSESQRSGVANQSVLGDAREELVDLAGKVSSIELRTRLTSIANRLEMSAPRTLQRVLSPREVDVLALVEVGCTNKNIAEQLMIEQETVKSYLRSAMQRLGARNRTQAVALARRRGELSMPVRELL